MSYFQATGCAFYCGGVAQVRPNGFDFGVSRGVSGEAVDFPATREEVIGEIPAYDSRRADNECGFVAIAGWRC